MEEYESHEQLRELSERELIAKEWFNARDVESEYKLGYRIFSESQGSGISSKIFLGDNVDVDVRVPVASAAQERIAGRKVSVIVKHQTIEII